MGVPTQKRLRNRNDFQKVRSLGEHVFCKSFICQYLLYPDRQTGNRRLGVIASRRVGNSVKRSRGKRIIRELFRTHELRLPPNCDITVILRSSYSSCKFEELESQYLMVCETISKKSKTSQKCVKRA